MTRLTFFGYRGGDCLGDCCAGSCLQVRCKRAPRQLHDFVAVGRSSGVQPLSLVDRRVLLGREAEWASGCRGARLRRYTRARS